MAAGATWLHGFYKFYFPDRADVRADYDASVFALFFSSVRDRWKFSSGIDKFAGAFDSCQCAVITGVEMNI